MFVFKIVESLLWHENFSIDLKFEKSETNIRLCNNIVRISVIKNLLSYFIDFEWSKVANFYIGHFHLFKQYCDRNMQSCARHRFFLIPRGENSLRKNSDKEEVVKFLPIVHTLIFHHPLGSLRSHPRISRHGPTPEYWFLSPNPRSDPTFPVYSGRLSHYLQTSLRFLNNTSKGIFWNIAVAKFVLET